MQPAASCLPSPLFVQANEQSTVRYTERGELKSRVAGCLTGHSSTRAVFVRRLMTSRMADLQVLS
jgi:3-phenylpropionate/cinnamic acid dioxygenase small subunit